MIKRYIVDMARQMDCTEIILLADDIQQLDDATDRVQATDDLVMLIGQAADDRVMRNVFLDWAEEGGTLVLRDLFDSGNILGGRNYWNDPNLAHRIDILDSAALHIQGYMDELSRMPDICKLAVENGASYTDISGFDSDERAFIFIRQNEEHLSLADLRRYDVSMTVQTSDHLPAPG